MNAITRAIDGARPVAAAGLTQVNLRDLMTQDWPAPRYIFEPIIPRRETTLLGGHGGIGKSMLALTLAAHAACGRQWGPFPVVQCRAAYVSLEDQAATILHRLRSIVEAYRLAPEHVIEGLTLFDGSDCEAALAVEVMADGVRRLEPTVGMDRVAAAVKSAGLVVIDNASDAYAGNENARLEVRGFIRLLTGIARENDAGLLLLAHIDKSAARFGGEGNAYSGSTAWHNSVRSRLALLKGDAGIVLEHQKAQFSKEAEPVALAFVEHGVLWPQDAKAAAATASRQTSGDADDVLGVVTIALHRGVTLPATTGGGDTAWHRLAGFDQLPAVFRDKREGRRRFFSALAKLVADGKLVRAAYQKPDRHPSERYELPQHAAVEGVDKCGGRSPHTPLRSPAPARDGAGEPQGAGVTNSRSTPALPQATRHPTGYFDQRTGETVIWDGGGHEQDAQP